MTPAQITNDQYAENLLYEAARMMQVRCPRSAQARLRRIARYDAETYGLDYNEALRRRTGELNFMLSLQASPEL